MHNDELQFAANNLLWPMRAFESGWHSPHVAMAAIKQANIQASMDMCVNGTEALLQSAVLYWSGRNDLVVGNGYTADV